MTDLKKLRKLAEMATPGPWTGYNRGVFSMASPISNQGYGGNVCAVDMQKDFEFIKAANPQAIIEILDMVDRYREALSTIETLSSYSNRIVHIDTARKELHKIKWLAREALDGDT